MRIISSIRHTPIPDDWHCLHGSAKLLHVNYHARWWGVIKIVINWEIGFG